MRRWTGFLAGLSLLALVGCNHIAGICDCCNGCCGMGPVGPVPVGAAPAAPVMPPASVSYPASTSARSEVFEGDSVVPVTVHMPAPIIHSED